MRKLTIAVALVGVLLGLGTLALRSSDYRAARRPSESGALGAHAESLKSQVDWNRAHRVSAQAPSPEAAIFDEAVAQQLAPARKDQQAAFRPWARVSADPPDAQRIHEIFQHSTINALLEGVYDGSMTYGELRRYGDFGLGTFNALDGEMIAFDGGFYQVNADGVAHPVADSQRTPFATVLFFHATFTRSLNGPLDYAQLEALVDRLVESPNLFYALRVDGDFASVTARSVPRQLKPYPPLVEVAKSQPVFHLKDVRGTLV